jgi:hypothetical protein
MWSALGSGVNSQVRVLAVNGSDLYVGGIFTATAGGVTTLNYVAKWNGSSWSALGLGAGDFVFALAPLGNNLYVGGHFTWAKNSNGSSVPANYVAKWNGSSWSALGSGTGPDFNSYPWVEALLVDGTNLYAGGRFTTAGGQPAMHIARWNGSSWSAMGSGTDQSVGALALDGAGHLFVGGGFYLAGNKMSPFLARADLLGAPRVPPVIANTALRGTNLVMSGHGGGGTYYVLTSTNVAACMNTWSRIATNTFGLNGSFCVTNAVNPAKRSQFFRLQAN